jgi:hypothetical protein
VSAPLLLWAALATGGGAPDAAAHVVIAEARDVASASAHPEANDAANHAANDVVRDVAPASPGPAAPAPAASAARTAPAHPAATSPATRPPLGEIGRASCRERVS